MMRFTDYLFDYHGVLPLTDHERLIELCNSFDFPLCEYPTESDYDLSGYRSQVLLNKDHGEIYDLIHKAMIRTMPKVYKNFGDLLPSVYDKYSGYWLCKYPEGGFLSYHSDSDGDAASLTLSFNINDNYEGGEICFWRNTYMNTCANTMHVYPSNLLYPHEVKPVKKGIRYSVISWFGYQKGLDWS